MIKIAIDPGHGGRDSGAKGVTGVKEKVITLDVAQRLAKILAPVADVRLTREDDRALGPTLNDDLQARADMANNWGADIFVSIHCNSAANRSAHGCEVYTSPGQTDADNLAESIIRAMEAKLPEITFRKDFTDGDSDKEERFAVLMRTKMPAVLIELAFISNLIEEVLLESPEFQARAAQAIAEGIAGYLEIQLPLPALPDLDGVRIMVAGQVLQGKLIDERSYAPVRALAEALGCQVRWDGETNTVTIVQEKAI